MLNSLIGWSLRNRLVVLTLSGVVLLLGAMAVRSSPLDVFPEFAPPQVIIQTEAPGLSAEEVEALVTWPLEYAINGTSKITTVRSSSIFGLSVITVYFSDGTDLFVARQLIAERLNVAAAKLPAGVGPPLMAPITSASSTILIIGLTSDTISPLDLRSLADWTVKPRLLSVPGVAKLVTFGGGVKQYQVLVSPKKLKDFDITLDQVLDAAQKSNALVGAGYMVTAGQQLLIRGDGRVRTLEDLTNTVIMVKGGLPITLGQVAVVQFGPELKVGDAAIDRQDGVLMIVSKQPWVNTLSVTRELEKVLGELQNTLPAGTRLHPAIFRQASFIERAVYNVNSALLAGGVLVSVVLFLFLHNVRSALVSLTAIPLSLLIAIGVLRLFDITINTMTLAGLAIAIGEVVDDAIIDVENILRRLRENAQQPRPASRDEVILQASLEVRSSVVYATFIVALVFVPIFFLSGIEGKIFAPLGYAYVLSVMASLLVALTVTPALAATLFRKDVGGHESAPATFLKRHYQRMMGGVLRHGTATLGVAGALFLGALGLIPYLGGEFLPEFNEGHFILHMAGLPGTSLEESIRIGRIVNDKLLSIPGVMSVGQQIGRAELADDTYGTEYSEIYVALDPTKSDYRSIMDTVRREVAKMPGFYFNVMQFLSERIFEVISGTRAQVVIKIFGPDMPTLKAKADEVAVIVSTVKGVSDLQAEPLVGVPEVRIRFDRQAAVRYGVKIDDLRTMVTTAFRGTVVSQIYEGQRVYNLLVRYEDAARADIEEIRNTLIDAADHTKIPLKTVAQVTMESGLRAIKHEGVARVTFVQCNVSDRDVVGFVQEVRDKVTRRVTLPPGYYLVYGGEFASEEQARNEMVTAGLVATVGIVLLLFYAFGSARLTAVIMVNLPLAWIGGIAAAFVTGGRLSIGSLIGLVTLFGITTRNGIMLISHYEHLRGVEGLPFGRDLILRGAAERLVPILMTALVTGLGLLPIAFFPHRAGHEIEQPMAVVILGGLITSTLLNMVVVPILYAKLRRREAA